MKTITLLLINSLFINGVFDDETERDSVTLQTDLTELQTVDMILWRFNGDRIARINRGVNSDPVYDPDERFRDRLKMNNQTGDLTITNITSELNGLYELENINGENQTKSFRVRVFPKVETVMDGDSVSLHIDVTEDQRNEKIHWKIKHNNSPVAEIITENRKISTSFIEERFRDRMKPDNQTGDLIITHMKNEDSGQYKADVTIGNITHTILKTFSITDSEASKGFIKGDGEDVRSSTGLSSGAIAGICVAAAVVVVGVGVVIYRRRKMRHQDSNTGQVSMETKEPLRNGDASSHDKTPV